MYIYTRTCIYVYMYIYIHIHTPCAMMKERTKKYTHTCIYICIHMYIYIHMHTPCVMMKESARKIPHIHLWVGNDDSTPQMARSTRYSFFQKKHTNFIGHASSIDTLPGPFSKHSIGIFWKRDPTIRGFCKKSQDCPGRIPPAVVVNSQHLSTQNAHTPECTEVPRCPREKSL